MCGVVGYVTYKDQNLDIANMLKLLKHRGPDAQKYKEFNLENSLKLCLGHTRLSIQDLSHNADQPMSDIKDNYHIVYNGEVYNFNEIKTELITFGYEFKTSSDTEVILYSYIQWGMKAVERFIGMFSIVILDLISKELVFINDRLGVKPLYIYREQDILIFASEIKSILEYKKFKKNINPKALAQFMQYGYIQPPLSIFEKIEKIEPASVYRYSLAEQKIIKNKYWDVLNFSDVRDELNIESLHDLLKKSFLYRTVSDVPISAFLSSGVDSSLLSAVLTKQNYELNTITIGVDDSKYNEAKLAKEIAKGLNTKHNEYYIDEKEVINLVEKMPFYFDEPFADSSMYPTYLVNKMASKKYKVALSADGGDESFGGYSRYLFLKNFSSIISLPKALKILLLYFINILEKTKILNLFNIPAIPLKLTKIKNVLKAKNISEFYESLNTYIGNEQLKSLCKNYTLDNGYFKEFDNIENNDLLNKAMLIDYKTYLYQVLTKVDRTSMANSIEVREPLLDHKVIEYAISISSDEKIVGKNTKKPLKDILSEYLDIGLLTKTKKGFSVPIEKWLRSDLESIVSKYINKKSIELSNTYNWNEVEKIKNKFYNGSDDYIALWHIFIFQMWYNQWVDKIIEDNK